MQAMLEYEAQYTHPRENTFITIQHINNSSNKYVAIINNIISHVPYAITLEINRNLFSFQTPKMITFLMVLALSFLAETVF